MATDIYKYLSENEYPGRGICLASSPDGKSAFVIYFIMGRSVNSRNRIFSEIEGGIRTEAFDPSLMEDPHIIIYNPVMTSGETCIVTNGDQTSTIYDFYKEAKAPGFNFEAALDTRTFEDDGPNWTPRISGIMDMKTGSFKLSILKSDDGDESARLFNVYSFPKAKAGEGRFISTYRTNGSPLPSFTGEPMKVEICENSGEELMEHLWASLNEDNKISLFIRQIDLSDGSYKDLIRNKYTK